MPYDDLRAALRPGGFFVANLWLITRVGYALGRSGEVRHPSIPLAIASIAERVAFAWDGMPIHEAHAQRVESEILPKLQALVELENCDDPRLVDAAVNDALTAAAVALT